MTIKDSITLSDVYAPYIYADTQKTNWGVLFWADDNPTQHDANHAVILDNVRFTEALPEIRDFYLQKGREARIYLLDGQHKRFAEVLESAGFHLYSCGEFHHFLLAEENRIPKTGFLEIRELADGSEVTDILLKNLYGMYMEEYPGTINRMRRLLLRCIRNPLCRVYAGYYEGLPACIAMAADSPYGMTFFDLVETAQKFRCRGFARELISFMVPRVQKPAFLYSENPTAIHIYEQAGFRKIDCGDAVSHRAVYKK